MSERARGAAPGLDFLLLLLLLLPAALATAVTPSALTAQLRRDAPLQPVSEVVRGDWLVGIGLSNAAGGTYPISGYTGDLLSLGELTVAYGLGDRALIQVSGAVAQRLSIESASEASIPLDPTSGDVTTDAGDFRITTAFAPIGSTVGFSAGGLVEVKLPNSDEKKGIGTNTTDVTLGLIGSWGADTWRGTGTVGIAILEAPVDDFEQNDLVSYAFDVLVRASSRIRVALGVAGLASVRRTTPLGTESRGAATLGGEWLVGSFRLDASVARGYAGNTPDWRLAAGVAWFRSSGGGS
ncbi:MAG: hypothetical protein ACC682_15770 [Gemmatimonadota bacterium]